MRLGSVEVLHATERRGMLWGDQGDKGEMMGAGCVCEILRGQRVHVRGARV